MRTRGDCATACSRVSGLAASVGVGAPGVGGVPGAVGAPPRFAHQRLPLGARQALVVEVGARPFAAMVEEADIVVGLLQRLDLALDEAVELGQIGCEVGGQVEIQGALSRNY